MNKREIWIRDSPVILSYLGQPTSYRRGYFLYIIPPPAVCMYFWLISKQQKMAECWDVTSNFSLPKWVFLLTLLLGLSWSMLLWHKNVCGKGPWEAFLMADRKKPAPISNNENLGVKPSLVQPVKETTPWLIPCRQTCRRPTKTFWTFEPVRTCEVIKKSHQFHETFNHPYEILYIFCIFKNIIFNTAVFY